MRQREPHGPSSVMHTREPHGPSSVMHTREPHGPNPGAEEEDNVCETNKMKLKMTFPSFLRTTRPQRESTMGPWKKVIRVLSQLSVLTNV
eukprot:CAMPEP_0182861096 /NCGR_PEP_ID=MMETSP0034_2-20130328/5302_1 /TAXON_ID=156128 /ORGANISM="Nephroselmis pyriformis, Strain CCMP717" /LENGTH=89 /DNA_ID=CAMNT_0024992985 /DNA_START=425 /DNA_END=691 /DNA_ORIENTATION=-